MHRFETGEPSEELLIGRRALENLEEIELLEDFRWDPLLKRWVLFCSISLSESSSFIQEKTHWYVLVDKNYPFGEIGFYPAIENGLNKTFPHQNYNGLYDDDRKWRMGKLCLESSVRPLRRYGNNDEPQSGSNRLLWHFQRALFWLKLASKNELVTSEDHFELPHFPNATLDLIAFSESPVSLGDWENSNEAYGLVDFVELKKDPHILIVKGFTNMSKKGVYYPSWGTAISDSNEYRLNGLWIKLNDIPVISPWQAPRTLGELQQILLEQGIDLIAIIQKTAHHFRDGYRHILMLGFPIPEYFYGKSMVMNWQAVKLPVFSYGNKYAKGFRKGEKGYWQRDKTTVIPKYEELQWIDTENWHRNEILNRGKLSARVTQASLLQIGTGSLGSMVAEQLVRADQQKLTVVDPDVFTVGNLVRHTLGMQHIRKRKAVELSHKLNISVPHSKVIAFPNDVVSDNDQITYSEYRVIFDCTGEDHVVYKLEEIPWNSPKIFISASLGFAARRLYFFTHQTQLFSANKYFKLISPWISRERENYSEEEFPRDGIGCWSPVFPARIDDIWMMSSIVVKNIEKFIQTPSSRPRLLVYEQKWDGDLFRGVELISEEEWHE